MSAEKLAKVGEIMNGFIKDKKITGGIVLVASNGKLVFQETYGLRNLDGKLPVERDTIFCIYSMSKAIYRHIPSSFGKFSPQRSDDLGTLLVRNRLAAITFFVASDFKWKVTVRRPDGGLRRNVIWNVLLFPITSK